MKLNLMEILEYSSLNLYFNTVQEQMYTVTFYQRVQMF